MCIRDRGEEDDAGDENRGGQPLLPVVLLTDDQDGEGHHRDDLRRLEHDTSRVVQVGQRVVGQRHAPVRVHGEDAVVPPRTLTRIFRELHLERTAQKVRERRQDGHPRGELETRDAEHALLKRRETERRAERPRGENGDCLLYTSPSPRD